MTDELEEGLQTGLYSQDSIRVTMAIETPQETFSSGTSFTIVGTALDIDMESHLHLVS